MVPILSMVHEVLEELYLDPLGLQSGEKLQP